ncbi:DnaJ domain protein [Delphinella strobiligena]|nr:DnaJ domain protein [Delphinella strobiligena]
MARFRGGVILLVLCLVALVAAWSKEDHEIFRVRDEVVTSEGENATFYSFIGVKPGATQDEINKAYRKKSRTIHPDKARSSFLAAYAAEHQKPVKKTKSQKEGVKVTKAKQPSQKELAAFNKEASHRFSLLGLVANILRGSERERYDHFLHNGFPKWRGTGYYYQRFRPGLGSVLLGLFIVIGGGAHYIALYLGWKKQREFVERYIRHARRTAWGDESAVSGIPGLSGSNGSATPTPPPPSQPTEDEAIAMQWNRKQKRQQERDNRKAAKNPKAAKAAEKAKNSGISTPVEAELTSGPVGAKKRTLAPNGKVLIVDSSGNVYLEEKTEEGDIHEYLLDVDEIHQPTVYDTVLFKLPKWAYNSTIGKALNRQTQDAQMEELLDGTEEQQDSDDAILKSAAQPNINAESRKRKVNRKRG